MKLPTGVHSATPYLIFDGTATRAIEFYKQAFEAVEQPGRVSDPIGKVINADIMIVDSVIPLGDEGPWRIAESPRTLGGASSFVHLYVEDSDATIEQAVRLGASVLLPLKDQWYGDRSASIVDPFGQRWTI